MKVYIMRGMNKLPLEKRARILTMLVEGSSLRSISRVAGVSINTVTKAPAAAAGLTDKAKTMGDVAELIDLRENLLLQQRRAAMQSPVLPQSN
jgi:hypothetical protein